MPTRFGKFISGKHFSKLFLCFNVLFMCFAAYETNNAFCQLVGRTHIYGIPYIFFAIFAVLALTKKNVSFKWHNTAYKKATSLISGFFIYYFLVMLSWELICLAFNISVWYKAVGLIGTIGVSALIVLVGYLRTKTIRIKQYDVPYGNSGTEYRIALMSDIHLGVFVGEKHAEKIVRKVNTLCPDVVVISGDIFDVDNYLLNDTAKLKRISRIFRKMRASEGVYAVVGNHDPKIDNEAFKIFLKASKIKLLDNKVAVLSFINLIGRSDETNNERKEYEAFADMIDKSKPVVVLDHNPQKIAKNAECGADFVLCGHTHGGQMFPVTLFTRWANGKDCFYGHSVTGKTHSIITSGVGFFELPLRLGSSNEIVDISLLV